MESDARELLELTRENNKILRGMQRTARIGRFFRFIYWGLIVGSMIGAYYYVQPYIDQLFKIYNSVSSSGGVSLPSEVSKQLDLVLKNR